jgi:hypothetical protein
MEKRVWHCVMGCSCFKQNPETVSLNETVYKLNSFLFFSQMQERQVLVMTCTQNVMGIVQQVSSQCGLV